MNRAERRRAVADLITQHIVQSVYEVDGMVVQAYAFPDKGVVVVKDPSTSYKVEHHNVRFCCPGHCWHDIEQDALTQILDTFGYAILKVLKIEDPPEFK